MDIRAFEAGDADAVVALWDRAGLLRPWNDPRKDIGRKVAVDDGLFLVATDGGRPVGVAMGGYDGHRGWVNYLTVEPERRHEGVGRALLDEVERRLRARGCPKINVQVRATNTDVLAFYERLGFAVDDAVSLGKRLESDED